MGKYRKIKKENYWKGMTFPQKVDYFFQYYFWKVVIIIVAAVLVGLGIYQIATNYKPDYEVMFISEKFFLDNTLDEMEDYFNSVAIDNNKDGHEVAGFSSIVFLLEGETDMSQYNSNLQQKLVIQLSTGEPRILICSAEELDYLVESGLTLTPLPDGANPCGSNENAVLIRDTVLGVVHAFEDVPDDFLVCMVEMGENVKQNDKNISKRNYTATVFESLLLK